MQDTSIYLSTSQDPFENLVLEDWLLRNSPARTKTLLIYKNLPCVVMGRFQNPWIEVNLPILWEKKIPLVRRQSGGGTVYHDLGNLNFCFISDRSVHNKELNVNILCQSLERFDLKAYPSGRSDILIDDFKISGSAFKQTKDRAFHHGTLLLDAKLSDLNGLLKAPPRNIECKSVKSTPRKVVNLKELKPKLTEQMLVDSLVQAYKENVAVEKITPSSVVPELYLRTKYQGLKSWEWIYGETPKYWLRYLDCEVLCHKGRIKQVLIPGVEELDEYLQGELMQYESLSQKLGEFCKNKNVFEKEKFKQVTDKLLSEILPAPSF